MSCPFAHAGFKRQRADREVLPAELDGDVIPMILRHADVKAAARDWRTYSSDAPFRVPIPSEEDVRSVRQLPIETDPPEHTEFRKIVEPFFLRPRDEAFVARVEGLLAELLAEAAERDSVEVVREFALPLQSRALTYLLNVPESEAEEWISWGTHVFRDGGDGAAKGSALEDYIHRKLDEAERSPGEDFFSVLTQAEFQGRKLTREEAVGFVNLTFAGGRDTVIQSVAVVIGYVAENPATLQRFREEPKLVMTATEEFVRVVTPLTHIGRVCREETEVFGERVPAGERVSLCWASANYDQTVFEKPEEVQLDRKPNPHLGFGSGPHICLGALHARVILRALMKVLAEKLERVDLLEAEPHTDKRADYQRTVGYDQLRVRLVAG